MNSGPCREQPSPPTPLPFCTGEGSRSSRYVLFSYFLPRKGVGRPAGPGEGTSAGRRNQTWYRHPIVNTQRTTDIVASGRSLGEVLSETLRQVVIATGSSASTTDGSLAIPLRAREQEETALVDAMVTNLLDEIAEGAHISSIQIDGLIKRDGDFVCWGYAFASPQEHPAPGPIFHVESVTVTDEQGQVEIRFALERQGF
jgi:hypothetical protein